jgi:TPR repeat protein
MRKRHYSAMNNFALLKLSGKGIPQDEAGAVQLFEQAAEHGIPSAKFNLSVCLDLGRGVDQIRDRVTDLLRAADEGIRKR